MSKSVKAILLKFTGDITTIKCMKHIDIENPQLKHFMGIKNKGKGDITQIGSWEDIDMEGNIFYIYGWQTGDELKKNAILLPHPYDDVELYCDIVIVKTDINNNPCNLTEPEYETFYKEISGIIDSDNSDIDDDYEGEETNFDNDDNDDNEDYDNDDGDDDDDDDDDNDNDDDLIENNDELELTDEEI